MSAIKERPTKKQSRRELFYQDAAFHRWYLQYVYPQEMRIQYSVFMDAKKGHRQ